MADNYAPRTLGETDEEFLEEEETEQNPLDRIEELMRAQLDSNRDLIERVTGRQQPQQLQQEPNYGELEFTLDGLPDPAMDPAAFHREYAKRWQSAAQKTASGVEQRVAARMTEQTRLNNAVDKTNNLVREANPNLTDETIGAISQVVAARMKAEGKDPKNEILRSASDVARQIIDYADDMATQMRGEQRRPAPAGRAQVLGRGRGGGNPGKQGAAQRSRKDEADPLGLLRELQALQQKGRYY